VKAISIQLKRLTRTGQWIAQLLLLFVPLVSLRSVHEAVVLVAFLLDANAIPLPVTSAATPAALVPRTPGSPLSLLLFLAAKSAGKIIENY
jgi:hypothetical protein